MKKVNVLEPNDPFTSKYQGKVKQMLKDYQGTLEDLENANVFEPNDPFISKVLDIKLYLMDLMEAFENLDKAIVLEPCHAFILNVQGDVKQCLKTMKEP